VRARNIAKKFKIAPLLTITTLQNNNKIKITVLAAILSKIQNGSSAKSK
jgi:hypothetical protein